MTTELSDELNPSIKNGIRLTLLEQNVTRLTRQVEANTNLLNDLHDLLKSIRHVVAFVLVVAQILAALGIIFYPIKLLVQYIRG